MIIAIFDDIDDNDLRDFAIFFSEKRQTKWMNDISTSVHLQYDTIEINSNYRTVKKNGFTIELTHYEFDILYLLARHPGQVFSKKELYEQVWNIPYLGAENNVVSLIHRIRKKIEPDLSKPMYVLTVWGVGYKFNGNLGSIYS